MTYEMDIAGLKRELPLCKVTDDLYIGAFVMFGPKSLSAIERGTVGISLAALKRVCSALSVSSDSIIFGRTEENDVSALTARLALLTEEEFRLCSEIICKLLEALQHGKG